MTELRKPPASERGFPIFGLGAAPLLDSNQAVQFLGVHQRNTVKVCHEHYAPWIKERQDVLETAAKGKWE